VTSQRTATVTLLHTGVKQCDSVSLPRCQRVLHAHLDPLTAVVTGQWTATVTQVSSSAVRFVVGKLGAVLGFKPKPKICDFDLKSRRNAHSVTHRCHNVSHCHCHSVTWLVVHVGRLYHHKKYIYIYFLWWYSLPTCTTSHVTLWQWQCDTLWHLCVTLCAFRRDFKSKSQIFGFGLKPNTAPSLPTTNRTADDETCVTVAVHWPVTTAVSGSRWACNTLWHRGSETLSHCLTPVCNRVTVAVRWLVTTAVSGSRWAWRHSQAPRAQVTYLECSHASRATCRGYVTSWWRTGWRQ